MLSFSVGYALAAPASERTLKPVAAASGPAPSTWEVGGSLPMNAASTYKLPALMEEAQLVAAGKLDPAGQVCYQDGDWEDGWFDDYTTGACYSRAELANRAQLVYHVSPFASDARPVPFSFDWSIDYFPR